MKDGARRQLLSWGMIIRIIFGFTIFLEPYNGAKGIFENFYVYYDDCVFNSKNLNSILISNLE